MSLKLYTPKPEQALQQAPETRPAVTSEWLKQLPETNPEEAAQRLLAELGRLNRVEIDDDLRSRLTLLYEPVIQKLIEALVVTLPENGTPQSLPQPTNQLFGTVDLGRRQQRAQSGMILI